MSQIDLDQIVHYENIVLLILFFLVLLGLIIAFLRGLWQGKVYGTYRLVSNGVLVIIALATLRLAADGIGNLDFSQWFHASTPAFEVNQISVSVQITTPYATAQNLIEQVLKAYNVAASPAQIEAYAFALAQSLVMLFILFIEGFLIATLFNFLIWLNWHILFKHFFSMKQRKVKRGRLISGAEQLVTTIVVGAMMMFPFTSLVNAINSSYQRADETSQAGTVDANASTATMIQEVLDTYNDSVFANAFFNWTKLGGETTFGTAVTGFVTQGSYGGVQASVIGEVSTFTKVASLAIDSGVLSETGASDFKWSAVLTSQYAPAMIEALSHSGLVQNVLPFAAAIAMENSDVKAVLGDDATILSDVNWETDLQTLSRAYKEVLDSGLINAGMIDENDRLVFTATDILSIFSESNYGHIHAILDDLDDCTLFDRLIEAAAYTEAKKEEEAGDDAGTLGLYDFMPVASDGTIEKSTLDSIAWGGEVGIVYDALFKINLVDASLLPAVLAAAMTSDSSSSSSSSVSSASNDAITSAGLDFICDHADDLKEIISGPSDEYGSPLNVDSTSGKSKSGSCLLDSSLIEYGLPNIIEFLGSTLGSAFSTDGKTVDLSGGSASVVAALHNAKQGTQTINYKKEFNHLLDIVTSFTAHDAGKAILKDTSGLPGVYFDAKGTFNSIDDDLLDALIDMSAQIDDSIIASQFVPTIFANLVDESSLSLSTYGLSVAFDWSCANLGSELSYLLKTYKKCQDLFTIVGGMSAGGSYSTDTMQAIAGKSEDLAALLDMFYRSKILNPVDSLGHANDNYFGLFGYIFDDVLGKDYGFSSKISTLSASTQFADTLTSDGDFLRDKDGNAILDGENGKFANVIKVIIDSGVFAALSDLSSGTASASAIKTLSKISFTDVFAAVGESQIVSLTMGDVLDKEVLPQLGTGAELGAASFNNVTDWAKEGAAIDKIIAAAATLGDLSNIDFLNSDPSAVNDIVSALANSQIFDSASDPHLFADYFYQKFADSLGSENIQYFTDVGSTTATTALKSDFESVSDWDAEAADYSTLIASLQRLGGLTAISSTATDLDADGLSDVLVALNGCDSLGRTGVYHVFIKIAETVKSQTGDRISFDGMNSGYLFDGTKIQRGEEIGYLRSILTAAGDPDYGLIKDGSYISGSLAIGNVSVDYFLDPFLQNLRLSQVFNTIAAGGLHDPTHLTVYESTVVTMLKEAEAYENGSLGQAGYFDVSFGQLVYDISVEEASAPGAWTTEIAAFETAVEAVQSSSLLASDGSLDLDALKDPATYFSGTLAEADAKEQELDVILNDVNSSKLLYRVLAESLGDIFDSVSIDGVSFSEANVYYAFDGVASGDLTYKNELPYEATSSHNELNGLVALFRQSASFPSTSLDDISAIDAETLGSILDEMSASSILNTVKTGSSQSVFQSLMAKVYGLDAIKSYIYSPISSGGTVENPKDAAASASYGDAATKSAYLIRVYFPALAVSSGAVDRSSVAAEQGYISGGDGSLVSLLKVFQLPVLSDALSGSSLDIDSLDGEQISLILNALNGCAIFSDCVPNIVASLCDGTTYSIGSDVDLSLASPYYIYYLQSDGEVDTGLTPDFSATYSRDEIDQLSYIFSLIKENKAALTNVDISSIDPSMLRSLLTGIADSYVFNLAGANAAAWSGYTSTGGADGSPANDLTVFEQIVAKVYSASGLSSLAYDGKADYAGYESDNPSNASARKLHDGIVAYDASTKGSSASASWADEVAAMTVNVQGDDGLIYVAKKQGVISSSSHSLSALNLGNYSPTAVKAMMTSLNRLSIVHDALSYSLKDFMTSTVDLDRYSSYAQTAAVNAGSYGVSFALAQSIGAVSVTMASEQSPSLSVVFNGSASFASPVGAAHTAGTNVYVYDLDGYSITGFSLSGSVDIASVSYTSDSARYELTASEYSTNAIDAISSALNDFFQSDATYFSFAEDGSGKSSLQRYLENGHSSSTLLGFFSGCDYYLDNGYDAAGNVVASAAGASYLSRDVSVHNLLNIASGSIPVNFGDLIGGIGLSDYAHRAAVAGIFASSSYSLARESSWIDANLISAAAVDLAIEHADSFSSSYGGLTLPVSQVSASLLSGSALSSEYAETLVSVNAADLSDVSGFGKHIVAGLLASQESLKASYLSGGSYFTGLAANPPAGAAADRSAYGPTAGVDFYAYDAASQSFLFTPFADTDSSSVVNAAVTLNSLNAILFGTSPLTAAQIAAAQNYYGFLDASSGESQSFAKLLYLADEYDWLVDRGFFYGAAPDVDYPNPYAAGFAFASVGARLA